MYYIKSRFYDAAVARFIQEDVYTGDKKDPLSLNLYTYVVNNPLKYLDPTGRIPNEIKINGKSIGYLKGYGTGVYGSMRDIVSAYGGYISRQDNVYYAQIGDVKLTFNLKDAKIGQTYAFQAKGNKTKFDYNYFVLTEDVEQKGAVKILVNIESFVKVFSSNPNDMQKIYWNLNTFFSDINQLEAAAKDYKKNKNHSYYAQLVLQQMRKHNYDGIMWDRVAGNIDEGFTKYLKKNNKLYLSFMGDVVLYDFTTGGAVDLPHFAATLNALLYETHPTVLTGAPALGAGRSEQDVDDLRAGPVICSRQSETFMIMKIYIKLTRLIMGRFIPLRKNS